MLVIGREVYDEYCLSVGNSVLLHHAELINDFIEATAQAVASKEFPAVSDFQTSVFDRAAQMMFDENIAKPNDLMHMLHNFNLHAFGINVLIASRLPKTRGDVDYEVTRVGKDTYAYYPENSNV